MELMSYWSFDRKIRNWKTWLEKVNKGIFLGEADPVITEMFELLNKFREGKIQLIGDHNILRSYPFTELSHMTREQVWEVASYLWQGRTVHSVKALYNSSAGLKLRDAKEVIDHFTTDTPTNASSKFTKMATEAIDNKLGSQERTDGSNSELDETSEPTAP